MRIRALQSKVNRSSIKRASARAALNGVHHRYHRGREMVLVKAWKTAARSPLTCACWTKVLVNAIASARESAHGPHPRTGGFTSSMLQRSSRGARRASASRETRPTVV